jgi:hypothetical protein
MTIPTATVTAALESLTPAGRKFMELVGSHHFDFFDDGIVAGSGNWGENLTWQAAGPVAATERGVAGVMSRLAAPELGLWVNDRYAEEPGEGGKWWELTELGALVALAAAGVEG